MHQKVDYERHMSVTADRYCRHLDSGALTNDKIEINIDICCTDSPFDRACFVPRTQYWLIKLYFEVGACQAHHDLSARLFSGREIVELFAACAQLADIICQC